MERSHDLAKSGAAKLRVPSGAQRVPAGLPSTRPRPAVTPSKQHGSAQRRIEFSEAESAKARRGPFHSARGKLIVLAVLLGLWGAIFWGRSPSPSPPRVAAPRSADVAGLRGPSANAGAGALPSLKLELLTTRHEPYVPAAVSLFSVPPPPPPPVEAISPAVAPPPSPPPPDPFVEEAKHLRYVGFFKSDVTVAAVITQGTQLYIAAGGDTVAGRFRVVSVHEDTVTLTSPEGDKQVRLAMAAASGAAGAAAASVAPVMVAAPVFGGGGAQGESAGDVAVGSEPAAAKPTPVAGPVIRSRAERSEMYRALARTGQQ